LRRKTQIGFQAIENFDLREITHFRSMRRNAGSIQCRLAFIEDYS
jgi:hypothetical protein